MAHQIYTLWASLKGEEPGPWMIAAEDEFSWEGDPDRCEKVFADARALAAKNDWEVRELVLTFEYGKVIDAFIPAEIPVNVEAAS